MQTNYWYGFLAVVRQEIRRFTVIWLQTILPPAITTALYFLIFGQLVGSRIGSMEGFSYVQFIAPGLIMMSVISNAYANVSTSFFMAKFLKNIEEVLVSPLPNYLILLGYIVGGIARALIVGFVVAVTASFFTHLSVYHLGYLCLATFLAAAVFSTAGFINALFAKKFDAIAVVPVYILTPLTYLGGVFFSVNSLSGFWKEIAYLNPILYFINIFRYGMLGVSEVNVTLSVVILLACLVGFFIIALQLLNQGVGVKS